MKHAWVFIVVVGGLVYSNSLHNGFHYDDEHSIQQNIHLKQLSNIPRFFVDPGMFSVDPGKRMYRPLLLVTYALNYAAGGDRVTGFHVVNLFLHLLCALGVRALGRRLSGREEVGLAAGMLFAVYPLTTEPVNYISSRSESLAGLFYLFGIVLYLRGADHERGRAHLLALPCLGLGLLSKATVVTLPAVLLLWELLLRPAGQSVTRRHQADAHRGWARLARRQAPFWALAVIYVGWIWHNGYLSGSLRAPVRPMWEQSLTQSKAVIYYLYLLIVPIQLNVEHQFSVATHVTPGVAAAWLLIGSLVLGICRGYRQGHRTSVFLVGMAAVTLLPVLVMPLNVLVNERRLYLPLAAFSIGVGQLLMGTGGLRRRVAGRLDLGTAMLAVLLIVSGSLTLARNRVWRDEFSLWEDALRKAPLMPRVHLYLGNAYKSAAMVSGDTHTSRSLWERARAEYRRTEELDPRGILGLRGLNNVGAVCFMLGDMQGAEQAYRKAVQIDPLYADGIVNLGSIYHDRARRRRVHDAEWLQWMEQARKYYLRALRIQPNHPLAHANLGLVYADMGDLDRAREEYERAYQITPRDARLLNNMGNLYVRLARKAEGDGSRMWLDRARRAYSVALQINPTYRAPRKGLEEVRALEGGRP